MSDERRRLDYDDLAAEYARHRRVHPGVLGVMAGTPRLSAASTVAEVGCGTGNYLLAMRERVGCRCIGIDPSGEMLSAARARSGEVDWRQGRAERLELENEAVDLVYSVDVIHHVGDRAAFFREAARVLRAGGSIWTATDSADDIARRRPLSSHFPETVAVELARYPAIETLRAEMADAGFVGIGEERVELAYDLANIQAYRDRAFSSLHLIPAEAVARGVARLEAEVVAGGVRALSLYTVVGGRRSM